MEIVKKIKHVKEEKIINGRCECNKGRIFIDGKCKKNNKCKGGRLINGRCVCNNGKSPVNGRCKKEKKCPKGFVKRGKGCVKKKCVGKNFINTEH